MATVIDLGNGYKGRVSRTRPDAPVEWTVLNAAGVIVYGGISQGDPEAEMRARIAKGGIGDKPAKAAKAAKAEPAEETAAPTPEVASAPEAAEPDDDADSGKKLKGKLPEGFPGKAALDEAGYGTYAKVRKLHDQGKLTEVPGIGEVTAGHIGEALSEG